MVKEKRVFEEYIVKGPKHLRYGYTTGSCATAAAKAATYQLLSQDTADYVELMTPKGFELHLEVETLVRTQTYVKCAITKDGGDDPDVTHGMKIYATVTKTTEPGITIDGGIGIGRVTKPGLKIQVGEAAINPVPRKTICQEVQQLCHDYNYEGGLSICIEAPEGVEIAKKTFNERLGIVGGISILGTTGIVEPMSEAAIVETIYTEMKMLKANGYKNLLVCPGNYGLDFINNELKIKTTQVVKCSNFVGEMLDYGVYLGFDSILMIGHIGKFIKLAAGIMNTHSKYADGRIEVLCAHAARVGAASALIGQLWETVTTDEAIKLLKEAGIVQQVLASIISKIRDHVDYRVKGQVPIQVIVFSDVHGYLGSFEDRNTIVDQVREEYRNER